MWASWWVWFSLINKSDRMSCIWRHAINQRGSQRGNHRGSHETFPTILFVLLLKCGFLWRPRKLIKMAEHGATVAKRKQMLDHWGDRLVDPPDRGKGKPSPSPPKAVGWEASSQWSNQISETSTAVVPGVLGAIFKLLPKTGFQASS